MVIFKDSVCFKKFLPVFLILVLFVFQKCCCGTLDEDISQQLDKRRNGSDNFLSRKRRYLTFPEGSSFQVVFCLTYPSIAVGSIFVFGNTAALAWELPSTPIFYNHKDFITTTTEEPTTEAWNVENLIHHEHDYQNFQHFDYPEPHQSAKDRHDSLSYETRHPISSYRNPFSKYALPQSQKYGYSSSEYFPRKANGYFHLQLPQNYPQKNNGYYSTPPQKDGYFNSKSFNHNSIKPAQVSQYQKIKLNSPKKQTSYQNYESHEKSQAFKNKSMEKLQKVESFRRNYEQMSGYSRLSYQGQNARSQIHPSISEIDPIYHGVHRRTRRDLYDKLQSFLTTLNIDGKSCILKAICEANQKTKEKGSFMEEIIKTIFRIKPDEGYPNEDHYDYAVNQTHSCEDQYPACKGSVFSNMFVFNK